MAPVPDRHKDPVSLSYDPPGPGAGARLARQTGVSQRGQAGFQRSRPPDTPHLTIGTTPPGARASRPQGCPFGCRSVSLRCCSRSALKGREPTLRLGRSRGRAPLPVDCGGGDGRSCGRILCGRDASRSRVGFLSMTGSHQRDKSAEAFWRQLSLKQVHQSSCLI